jgi:hypothetical protein
MATLDGMSGVNSEPIEQPCPSCRGQGWKYLSPRRGMIRGELAGSVPFFLRVRDNCSLCAGSGLADAA